MGMNVSSGGGSEPDVMVDINTTPLIDVMLVLLIMLIITIPIQTHAIKMNLPIGNPPPPITQPEVVQVDIDFDGTTTWNGQPVPDRAALESQARAGGRRTGAGGDPSAAEQAGAVQGCRGGDGVRATTGRDEDRPDRQ